MKKSLKAKRFALTLALAMLAVLGVANAETFKKLHSAPQLIISSTAINNTNEYDSTTIDLSGGSLDKVSYLVYVTSTAGSGTMTLATSLSADGGTTWVPDPVNTKTLSPNGLTPLTSSYVNIAVSPATKLKLTPTIGSNTTFYTLKIWALPSVD